MKHPQANIQFVSECLKKEQSGERVFWKEVAAKLGITYDSLMGLKRRLSTTPEPKPNVIEAITIQERELYEREIDRLESEKRKLEFRLKESYQDTNLQERILAYCRESVTTIPRYKTREQPHKVPGIENETAVCLLSCIHVGEVVSSEEMGGLGEYDFNIFLSRAAMWEDKVYDLLFRKMTGYTFDKVVILGLGDFISGIIHQELLETNEFNIVEQVFKTASVMSQAILNLHLNTGVPIYFEGVVGNHGRVKKDYYFKNTYVNWDYVCYNIMALLLANYPAITFKTPKSFYSITEIRGNKFLFFHGNNIKSWNSIPWYGVNRMAANFQSVLSAYGKSYDYIVLSHFHQNGMVDAVKGEYIMNGTWKGGDEYAFGSLGVVAEPKQWLFSVNERKGVTWRIPLYLQEAKPYDGRYRVSEDLVAVKNLQKVV